MTPTQKLNKCTHVFGWINTTGNDGDYIELKKSSVALVIQEHQKGLGRKQANEFMNETFVLREDGDLYIS